MKKIFTLIAVALIAMTAMAETATFTFSTLGGTSISSLDEVSYDFDSYVKMTFYRNDAVSSTGDPQPPTYNKNGYVAFYSKNSVVISGEGVEITKVTFNCTDGKPSWVITENSVQYKADNPSWTGKTSDPITFIGKSAAYIASITVEYTILQPQADDTSAGYLFFADGELKDGETAKGFTRTIGNCSVEMKSTSDGALVDGNSQWFGDADVHFKTTHRWKPNTKSTTSKATIANVTIPADGKFTIYARTAKDSEDRNVIIAQDGVELVNKVLHENQAIEMDLGEKDGEGNPKKSKIYPAITVDVKKGKAEITWPENGIFIYGYKYVSKFAKEEPVNPLIPTGISGVVAAPTIAKNVVYNLAGQRVSGNAAKGIVVINGKKVIR